MIENCRYQGEEKKKEKRSRYRELLLIFKHYASKVINFNYTELYLPKRTLQGNGTLSGIIGCFRTPLYRTGYEIPISSILS